MKNLLVVVAMFALLTSCTYHPASKAAVVNTNFTVSDTVTVTKAITAPRYNCSGKLLKDPKVVGYTTESKPVVLHGTAHQEITVVGADCGSCWFPAFGWCWLWWILAIVALLLLLWLLSHLFTPRGRFGDSLKETCVCTTVCHAPTTACCISRSNANCCGGIHVTNGAGIVIINSPNTPIPTQANTPAPADPFANP